MGTMESKQGMIVRVAAVLDELVRDFCAVGPRPKSEVRRRILEFAEAYRAQGESKPPRLLNDAFQMIGRLRSYLACGESTSKYDDDEIAALLERLRAAQPDSRVERLEEALRGPRTVVIVFRNADFTEGRGPMLFDSVFSSMEKAEAYVDGKKEGIFGFKPDERFNFRLSVACKNPSRSGGWGGYKFEEVELG